MGPLETLLIGRGNGRADLPSFSICGRFESTGQRRHSFKQACR